MSETLWQRISKKPVTTSVPLDMLALKKWRSPLVVATMNFCFCSVRHTTCMLSTQRLLLVYMKNLISNLSYNSFSTIVCSCDLYYVPYLPTCFLVIFLNYTCTSGHVSSVRCEYCCIGLCKVTIFDVQSTLHTPINYILFDKIYIG